MAIRFQVGLRFEFLKFTTFVGGLKGGFLVNPDTQGMRIRENSPTKLESFYGVDLDKCR